MYLRKKKIAGFLCIYFLFFLTALRDCQTAYCMYGCLFWVKGKNEVIVEFVLRKDATRCHAHRG